MLCMPVFKLEHSVIVAHHSSNRKRLSLLLLNLFSEYSIGKNVEMMQKGQF